MRLRHSHLGYPCLLVESWPFIIENTSVKLKTDSWLILLITLLILHRKKGFHRSKPSLGTQAYHLLGLYGQDSNLGIKLLSIWI